MSNENSKPTQHNAVLRHLQDFGTLTSWTAFEEYGITRLSAIIYDLRKEGCNITSKMLTKKNRYGNITNFSEYKLEKTLDTHN